jgi:hypothetical protein
MLEPTPKVQLFAQSILVDVVSSGDHEPSLLPSTLDKAASICEEFEPSRVHVIHYLFAIMIWGPFLLLAGRWKDLKFI